MSVIIKTCKGNQSEVAA